MSSLYIQYGKRSFDFTAAIIGLAVLSPIFLLISIVVKITSKGPVFLNKNGWGKILSHLK